MQRQPVTFKKLLFPVDFSPLSAQTAAFVREIAQHYKSELHLLHVMDASKSPWAMAPMQPDLVGGVWIDIGLRAETYAAEWEETKRRSVDQLKRFFPEYWEGLNLRFRVVEGEPAGQILEYAKENEVDLIMMPTHGHGPFRRFLLGSVTAKVLHDAPCHVWTDSHFSEEPDKESKVPRHVLCAVDLSPHSVDLIAWTMAFAQQWNAEVRLVHAVPSAQHVPLQPDDTFTRFLVEDAKKHLEKLQHRLNINLGACVLGGEISAVVREAALRHQADVIILGPTEHHGYLGRLRSHGYNIVRDAPCPVIRM